MYSREEIIDVLKNITGIDADIDYDTKLIKYGIESLSIMKLVGNFRKSGYRVKFADLMENPTVNAWYELLENIDAKKKDSKKEINKQTSDVIVKVSEDDYNDKEPFDITDVQYAYLIGRDDEQILGGVDCHAYYEFKGINVSLDKLSDAWIKLQLKHRALRTVFIDGKQFVRDEIYKDNYHVIDVSDKSNSEVENECERIRNHISHRKLNIENGEVAGLTICLLPENVHIIYLDFALIVADVKSIQIMLRDLANIYVGKENAEIVNDWNFKKYNILQNKARRAEKEEAVKYWEKMVESMPLFPDLPLKKGSHEIKKIKNTHYTQIIKADAWKRFSEKSKKSEVTAPMALLTAYAQTIEKWSNNKEFLINVPLFDRAAEYEGIENAVGDFTTLLLTSHDFNERKSFEDRIKITQSNFVRDMHYAACSGVEVQRMLQKKHIKQREFAPVVFACNIGLDFIDNTFSESLGEIHYMVSQTPQVWIDCQLFVRNGELHISWDVCDELFYDGMPKEMFSAYIEYINELADADSWNNIYDLDVKHSGVRKSVEETIKEYPVYKRLLFDGLIKNAKTRKDAIALYDSISDEEISYKTLYENSIRFANMLKSKGVSKGEKIAIRLPRGKEQIFAIYGILMSGCVYVPISYNQPLMRIKKILDTMEISYVVSNEDIDKEIKDNYNVLYLKDSLNFGLDFEIKDVNPDDLAYIIMTSGSTGEPKGVEIMHQSVANTIVDVNKRNKVNENDNILGVSAIDFDLSVYDIFGSSFAGSCLNILGEDNAKDSEYWLELINKRNITIWNSVPILADMLLTAIEHSDNKPNIKRILMSGDWISKSLVKRIFNELDECVVVAMGGATEGSIWSNEYVVDREDYKEFNYMPYGYALTGQMYRIVDDYGNDLPDYVTGELLIGGFGVANGYFGDKEKNKSKFSMHNGMRFYHTGDLGRFIQNGMIEFLGRKDNQVKVKGHRIELGEIEVAALTKVENALAMVVEHNKTKQIVLFYTGDDLRKSEELRESIALLVPAYMVPKTCVHIDAIPMTANGKADRKQLENIGIESLEITKTSETTSDSNENKTEFEKTLSSIWSESLEVSEITSDDDYFELGGNSLNATKTICRIKEEFGIKLKISQIFKYPTLHEMSKQIEKARLEKEV